MPDIQKHIYEARKDDGNVMVIGLNPGGLTGQDQAYVGDYVDNLGITFPVVMDQQYSYGKYGSSASIAPFPLDVVVDATGKIMLIKRDFDIDAIDAALDAARGGL